MRSLCIWILRICVSAALLAIVFRYFPIGEVWSAMRGVPIALWIGVLVVFLIAQWLSALKWWLLTDQTQIPFEEFLRAHFVGLMSNLCLPSLVGGDVVRAVWVFRRGVVKARIGVASVADRLLDTICLLVLAVLGAFFVSDSDGSAHRFLLLIAVFLGSSLVGIAAAVYFLLRWRPDSGKLRQIVEALEAFVKRPGVLIRSFSLSLLIQSCLVGLNVLIGISTGVDTSAAVWFLAWPLAKLAALLPVTLAGLGVRESALILIMKPFGADPTAVTATGLLWQTILFAGGLFGGLVALHFNASSHGKKKKSFR